MPPQAADQHGDSPESPCTDNAANRHLIVASNRGTMSFTSGKGDSPQAEVDLAHSPRPAQDNLPVTWISVAASGADRAAAEQAENGVITRGLPPGQAACLISPSRRAFHRYYNIICNPLLWFMHHRSWGFTHTPNIDREAHTAWEQGFAHVSQMFADAIAAESQRVQLPVTVQLRGYHTHLVGGLVREKLPEAEICYSLDVPWPDASDWMMFPARWRDDIFKSMLACDVVNLTSERDARSLLAGFEEFVPGAEISRDRWQVTASDGHTLKVRVDHPAVDKDRVLDAAASSRCESHVNRFSLGERYTFVTTDRTEPHKNIVRTIRAYGSLLDQHRDLAEETRFLIVLSPPSHLSQNRRYLSEIEKASRDVNGRHRTQAGKPVELIVENNYPMALAAMTVADTLISVPLADASFATQLSTPLINQRACTFILSETTSAAELFGDAAAQVSPADVEAIKQEMLRSFELTEEERQDRFAPLESVALEHISGGTRRE